MKDDFYSFFFFFGLDVVVVVAGSLVSIGCNKKRQVRESRYKTEQRRMGQSEQNSDNSNNNNNTVGRSVVVVRLYSTHTETRPQDGGEMVIGYKIMSDSAYGTGTRWSYGQSPQHSPPPPAVVGGCSLPMRCQSHSLGGSE